MNRATRPSASSIFNVRASLFHSTPVLDRRRRTHWDSGGGANRDSSRPRRFNHYSNRYRKLHSKQTLLRNVSDFADQLFQSWQNGFDEYDSSSRQNSSWFRREYEAKGPQRGWTSTKGPHSSGRRAFHFCEDGDDSETIFRSAFGVNRHFYWSFVEEDFPRWKGSSGFYNTNRTSWNWRHRDEEDYDSSSESDSSESDMTSDRVTLGLRASGPLKLDDVKNAYRACALKWHPDRHHGSSKAVAEEKFKACSAAYQSICDKLTLN
ncbi:Chaperone protein like [Actinidia chinensis var. chinensis]|uniref:Chaperone protein like n=1 Tax=Actinidia chinensis var. chinensis TaxID=1590841 RepID=A0A2R6P2P9_ACTCC|nr:Chaperone protein like [Actinidia chinensis var. chinensis]